MLLITDPEDRSSSIRSCVAWCLLALLPLAGARAGDEEINPSVYQVFDPETGYFIDVEPPPDQQPANSQPALPATVAGDPQPAAVAPVTTTPEPVGPAISAPVADRKPLLVAGIVTVLVLVAGLALRKKKGVD